MMAHAVQPARFVTIALAEALTGYTKDAIQTKIARGTGSRVANGDARLMGGC